MTISATTQGLRPGVCTSTSRPSAPFDGQVIYETDTNRCLVWDNSAWVQLSTGSSNTIGLHAVIPTSVAVTGAGSSSSIGTNGKVTFTSAATVSLNGCFTSAYTNYTIVADFDASTTGLNMQCRLRAAGTDNTTASSYVNNRIAVNNTTVAGLRQTLSEWVTGSADSTSVNALTWQIFRPAVATKTGMTFLSLDGYLNGYYTHGVGTHNQSTAYDGFSFYPNGGSITGTVTVYGYFG